MSQYAPLEPFGFLTGGLPFFFAMSFSSWFARGLHRIDPVIMTREEIEAKLLDTFSLLMAGIPDAQAAEALIETAWRAVTSDRSSSD